MFKAFDIMGMGIVGIWVVFSFVGAKVFTSNTKEFILGSIVFLACGMLLLFADMSEKIILLVILILTVMIGVFKLKR